MIVMYYSNVHGQAGTSTNMLVTSMMADILYRKKSILLQTQFRLNQLEISLLGKEARHEILEYESGIDALMKGIKAGRNTKELLETCCISLQGSKVDFLPGTNSKNKELYEQEILKQFHDILSLVKNIYEIVYVDIGYVPYDIAGMLLKEADLVAVNLSQNLRVLNDFFNNFNAGENVIYIIGNYDKRSSLNIRNLMGRYKKLKRENCFTIPYNTELRDAISDAGMVSFFYRNMTDDREDECYGLISEVRKLAEKIIDFLEREVNGISEEY